MVGTVVRVRILKTRLDAKIRVDRRETKESYRLALVRYSFATPPIFFFLYSSHILLKITYIFRNIPYFFAKHPLYSGIFPYSLSKKGPKKE